MAHATYYAYAVLFFVYVGFDMAMKWIKTEVLKLRADPHASGAKKPLLQ